jgi:alpha-L-rhamnosidase
LSAGSLGSHNPNSTTCTYGAGFLISEPFRLALLSLALLPCLPALTQPAPVSHWDAEWIACPNAPDRDEGVFHFRKQLTLTEQPATFIVEVSADNQFVLYVNGQRAGSGPARGDLGHWRFETIDLAPFLHAGENWIGATVWNFGTRSALAQVSDRTAFYLNTSDPHNSALETNATWEVEREMGIESLPPAAGAWHGYYAADPPTRMDSRQYDWEWQTPASHVDWQRAVSLGKGGLRDAADLHVNWRLVPDALPPMQMEQEPVGRVVRSDGVSGAADFPSRAVLVPPHSKASLLIDRTHLTTAYPELTVNGGKAASVRLTYTEALRDKNDVKGNRNQIEGKTASGVYDEFVADGKDHRVFEPLVWRTWRYLQIDVETAYQPLRLESLRSWFTAYPFIERGSFRADDTSLDDIWATGWRTARLDAHTTYMDTPYWEQLQYVGDTRIQALISYAVAGDDRLAMQAIEAINNTRLPDGITLSRGPASLFQAIPPFSLFWVDMVHDFWMYRDDPGFVREQLPGTRAVLQWFLARIRGDGLIGKLPWWPFVDWTPEFQNGVPPEDGNGGSAIITLQLVAALRDAADLETVLGDSNTAELYRNAAERSANAVRTLCWNPGLGLVADTKEQKHYSQETNAFAVWLDVIPPGEQRATLNEVLSTTDSAFSTGTKLPAISPASYYFRFYLSRAIDHAGMGDVYTDMLQPWRKMLALGLTTWAEKPEPTRSDSHAWSASPNYDLPTIVAGIRPGSPGFHTVRIEPHLGPLKNVTARVPHPRGMIEVEFVRKLTIRQGIGGTQGVAARVRLPTGIDGELVWQGRVFPLHGGEQTLNLPTASSASGSPLPPSTQ